MLLIASLPHREKVGTAFIDILSPIVIFITNFFCYLSSFFASSLSEFSIIKDYALKKVTDDANHIPVRVESPIVVGSVKIDLMNYENLKSPITALTKMVIKSNESSIF